MSKPTSETSVRQKTGRENNDTHCNELSSDDRGFQEWSDRISRMSDSDASRFILNHILTNSDLADDDKKLLKECYEYCAKLIKQGKPLEIDLLRIYLGELKGYQPNSINLYNLIMLLGCCGICFTK